MKFFSTLLIDVLVEILFGVALLILPTVPRYRYRYKKHDQFSCRKLQVS
ncbi:hypothetical protein PP707_05600 [Acetobacter pasteurianus]|nr:hypothetical protein [Acetobacter pasteurianus]